MGAVEGPDAGPLVDRLAAVASAPRMRILAALAAEDLHVSELARRMGTSRQLLYLHLTKLEQAGYVGGTLELGPDGKAVKTYRLLPFSFTVDIGTVLAEVRAHDAGAGGARAQDT